VRSRGFASRLGIGVEQTWGQAVKVSRLLPFTSESLTTEDERVESGALVGTPARRSSYCVFSQPAGDVTANLTYADFDEVFYAALGAKTTSGETRIYEPAEDLPSLTVAINKGVSVHEFVGMKVNKLTISVSDGKLQAALSLVGKSFVRGSTNTVADLEALPMPGREILLPDCALSVGGKEYAFSEINLTIDNKLAPLKGNTLEPLGIERNGKREVSFSLTLPAYEVDDFYSSFESGTETYVILRATDGTNSLTITLPRVVVQSVDTGVSGEGVIPQKVEFVVLRGKGALGISEELRIEVV